MPRFTVPLTTADLELRIRHALRNDTDYKEIMNDGAGYGFDERYEKVKSRLWGSDRVV